MAEPHAAPLPTSTLLMDRCIEICAPSRLHFGMLSFGHPGVRQFGGVGAMVQRPGLRIRFTTASRLETTGPHAARVADFARRWAATQQPGREPACRIEVCEAPPQHSGLGTGTQLGLSVARGLFALAGETPYPSAEQLAASVGRAKRSAVGTYGFVLGGLIAEPGRLPEEPIAPLESRVPLPPQWRFLLLLPEGERGLSGTAEQLAFAKLPPVPREVTHELVRLMRERLVPACRDADFAHFSDAMFRYGYLAGMCFADQQGGAFASPRLADLVRRIRALGVRGVGQSSWGPTIFALLPRAEDAEDLAARLRRQLPTPEAMLQIIAAPNNAGACVRPIAVPASSS